MSFTDTQNSEWDGLKVLRISSILDTSAWAVLQDSSRWDEYKTRYVPEEFGFGYVKALAQNFYGIDEVELIKATGLDIIGADVEAILSSAI